MANKRAVNFFPVLDLEFDWLTWRRFYPKTLNVNGNDLFYFNMLNVFKFRAYPELQTLFIWSQVINNNDGIWLTSQVKSDIPNPVYSTFIPFHSKRLTMVVGLIESIVVGCGGENLHHLFMRRKICFNRWAWLFHR